MRILIATSHRNMVGGVEKYLQAILPALIEKGHELALLYEYRVEAKRQQIDQPGLDIPAIGVEECGLSAAFTFAHDFKPDVVYSQGLESAGLQSALLSEYPTVFFAHNYVGTCISGEKCHAFPKAKPCGRQFGSACLALYHPRRCGGLHPATMWKMYRRAVERNAQLPKYAAVLVASAHMEREFQAHGVASERIHLAPLPNPQVRTEFDPAGRNPLRGSLLFLGRVTRVKGVAELFRAMPLAEQRLGTKLSVTVGGDGPERERLQQFARQNSIKANFTGWIGDAQKAELMAKSDLLIVPSLWPEPFGLVGIEAGACGLPAVAYDVGGISDWLLPGYSGELAPGNPPTVEGLAEGIFRAISDPVHYAALCRGAREVSRRFSLEAHTLKLENVLQAVLASRPDAPSKPAPGKEAIHADA